MPARNGEHGYGWVTRLLHWLTVGLLVAQLLVGYLLVDWEGPGEAREARLEERADRLEDRDDAGADRLDRQADRADDAPRPTGAAAVADAIGAIPLHVGLGGALLLVAVLRLWWRRVGGLPPWDPSLTAGERRAATWIERALLSGLVVAPLTGLVLVASGDDGLVWLHVASHVWLYGAIGAHLALVLGRRLRGRPALVARMVRGSR